MPRAKKDASTLVKDAKPKKTVVRKMVDISTDDFYNNDYEVVGREAMNMFEPEKNSNKFYIMEYHRSADGLKFRYFCSHGRVGVTSKSLAEPHDTLQEAKDTFDKKVREKKRKGYVTIDMATLTKGSDVGKKQINEAGIKGIVDVAKVSTRSSLDPKIQTLVTHIYEEANQAVSMSMTGSTTSDISGPLGSMGVGGIAKGRDILGHALRATGLNDEQLLREISIEFYKNVPRKMPSNLRKDTSWVLGSQEKIQKELEVLDLYEDSLRMIDVMGVSDIDRKYSGLQCLVEFVTDKSVWESIEHQVAITHAKNHRFRLKVKNIYAVRLRNEHPFDASAGGVERLFHGSMSANLVGIMSSHLRMPNSLGNGVIKAGAMFGPGIYFADNSTKSANYSMRNFATGRNRHSSFFLFMCNVALGKKHVAPRSHNFLQAPPGYDSVWGIGEDSLRYLQRKGSVPSQWSTSLINNEYIVYRENQVNIQYLVELTTV